MLTELSWLDEGKVYPPPQEKERIDQYAVNERLFLGGHAEVWREDFEQIARRLRCRYNGVETVLNYQQLLSKKTADFICGEPPNVETEGDTDGLAKLMQKQRFGSRLYEAFIDVSRYGNAVLKFVGQSITAVSPMYWFPIVAPDDLKTVTQHVVAYPITQDGGRAVTELYAEIHYPGGAEKRLYQFDGNSGTIGKLNERASIVTGIEGFAVQPLTNVTHSGSVFGLDDYSAVNTLIAKVIWRLHCADVVLDKHSDPSLSGPKSALTFDDKTGMYYLDLGNYFSRGQAEDPDVHYITWDGNLESSFKEIELLLNQVYILSEMGQAFIESGGSGSASSGTALKLRMVSPRIKAARLTGINEGTVRHIIATLAQLNGIAINPDTLTLHWHDGLPIDEVEQVKTLLSATGNKPIMSQFAALKRMGLSDAEAEAELEAMREESAARMPIQLGMMDEVDEDGEETDDPTA